MNNVYESVIEKLNIISDDLEKNSSNEKPLDLDKMILRQRIIYTSNLSSLETTEKTKLIQKLMMNNTKRKLVLDDIYKESSCVQKCGSHFESKNYINTKSKDPLEYLQEADYNFINDISCSHFQSNVKLYSNTTNMWYSCKNCYLMSAETGIEALAFLACGKCNLVTSVSDSDTCSGCEKKYAEFCCLKCRIFENNEENDIYHCPFCKECKLGEGLGIDYNHCFDCNCCMPLEMFHNEKVSHKCIKNNLSSDCTICGVRLNGDYSKNVRSYESKGENWKVQFLIPCNHAIHETCLKLYLDNGQYKCPICQISIVDMEINFKLLDEEIQTCPLPSPYNSWRCIYKCNDCATRGITSYHFLGIKCRSCYSFNTILLQVLKDHSSEIVSDDQDFGNTKRSTVSKEMVDSTFMSRGDSFKGKDKNGMDGFLNEFLSKDEDLSLSHLLVGLKQYYTKNKSSEDKEIKSNTPFENFDVNKVFNNLKSNVWSKITSANNQINKQKIDEDELLKSDEFELSTQSQNNGLLNDIGDSFKQFLSFLEDNEGHEA
ncbi:hypothetical protein QEN19_004185 [Hanseniaspora menglaensis]